MPPSPASHQTSQTSPVDYQTTPRKPEPALRFQIQDLRNEISKVFLQTVDPLKILQNAIDAVILHLYPSLMPLWKEVRSITLILAPGDGVADTRGLELDDAHKEIRLYMNYIKHVHQTSPQRLKDEIEGVIIHEMVHCWQHDGKGSAPVGLTEGVADWVRLQSKHAPPHWKKEFGGTWHDGYQHTAYFLDWIEDHPNIGGKGSIRRLNEKLCHEYKEDSFWMELFGDTVENLWNEYKTQS